jgi:hypothetical protein
VLIRVDGAGATHELIAWLTLRRPAYSVGFCLPADPGASMAELTGLFDLSG